MMCEYYSFHRANRLIPATYPNALRNYCKQEFVRACFQESISNMNNDHPSAWILKREFNVILNPMWTSKMKTSLRQPLIG